MALRLTSSILERQRTEQVRKDEARRTERTPVPVAPPSVRSTFENRGRVSEPAPQISDATEVRLSESAKAQQSEKARVTNSLSAAASFVNVAQDATESVNELLGRVKKIAEAIQNERADSPLRQGLADDAATVLAEIDTISANATFNGQSVLSGNSQIISLDPKDPGAPNGEGSSVFVLSSIPLNSSSLGLSSLDAAAFLSDIEGSIDTLDQAQTQVFSARAGLSRSSDSLSTFASEFGAERAQEVQGERALQAEQSQGFTEELTNAIKDSAVEPADINKLDPARVSALLEDGEDSTPKPEAVTKKTVLEQPVQASTPSE